MTRSNPDLPGNDTVSQQTILLVEDDSDIGEFMTEALNAETPYKTLHVTNATQALQTVTTLKPNLFILDYNLAGITGLELADRLHTIEGLAAVPLLLISANFPPHVRKTMEQRHIRSLNKPFDIFDLLKAVKDLLSSKDA